MRQKNPAGHGEHTAAPVELLNVPGGHGTGAGVPAGQYDPTGHSAATGEGDVEPAGHAYCAAHKPVGAVSPAVAQYEPAGHVPHCATLEMPNAEEYVPGGHGVGAGEAEGQ